MKILPNNSSLIYSGRIDVSDPFAIVWTYPGTFVKIRFKGNKLAVCLRNKNEYWDNYLGVVEGDVQNKLLIPKEGEATIEIPLQETPDNVHEVLIFKRQDACHELTILGFELDDDAELLEASPLPKRRIEVFGDSVSAGEVSEALDYVAKADPEHNGEYSNNWYSYAWMTARRLNAQIHDVAQGGIALRDHTGWFYEPEAIGMETAWNKIHYNPLFGNATEWDFSKYTPQVVIVAIGQNDNHPDDYMKEDYNSERSKQWREHYKAFIEGLKKQYPEVKIVCCTTLLCHDESWDRSIGEVVKELDHPDITQCLFTRNGKGTPGHLRIPEAEEMSQELAAYIEKLNVKGWEK